MLLRLAEGPVFENRETPDGRHQICDTPGVPLEVPALPERWLRARAWSLVPVADEVSDAVGLVGGTSGVSRRRLAGDASRAVRRAGRDPSRTPRVGSSQAGRSRRRQPPRRRGGHDPRNLGRSSPPRREHARDPGPGRRVARRGRRCRAGTRLALPIEHVGPRGRSNRSRRHVPGGARGISPSAGDRRPRPGATDARPPIRGCGWVARRRRARARSRFPTVPRSSCGVPASGFVARSSPARRARCRSSPRRRTSRSWIRWSGRGRELTTL